MLRLLGTCQEQRGALSGTWTQGGTGDDELSGVTQTWSPREPAAQSSVLADPNLAHGIAANPGVDPGVGLLSRANICSAGTSPSVCYM